ncbi:sulfatase-like hydrolase/transferase [Novipirellula artificiosorum]|uniref:Arylsulfatase n=1 Tax=Novipirellula artificiosorum TaxID=2528016 RepID=A0A5C6DSK0_9BACT|nr:sulfatase-like hydrolase/transferase [Novipirellula artificiosorum]TWU39612.1 Arylsulfatase [Novipirellula artificiosorum]
MSKIPLVIFIATIVSSTSIIVTCSADDRPRKPNIVLLLTDDLGWQDVKCYDIDEPSPMETPNIDALAKKGVMFWQGYSPTPVCASSRCAIMSGIHAARAQKTSVRGGTPPVPLNQASRVIAPWQRFGLPPDELTLPKLLQQNGYVTGHSGKWHMSKGGERADANRVPFGFDYTRCDRGSRHAMSDRLSGFATDAADDPYRLDAKGYPYHQTNEDALTFLKQNKDKPFFLYYATWLVHAPIHTRSEAHLQKYVNLLGTDPTNTPKKETPGQLNPFYAAMVQELDYYVGQVFDYLDQTEDPRWPGHNLSENTYLIFSSDNGGMEGSPAERFTDNRPLLRGKISAMEGGTRVPLIITGPGIPAGVQTDVMANGLDFYPTILSMVGVEKPSHKRFDGCDLTPLLLSDPTDPSRVTEADGSVRDTMVWHFPVGVALESTIRSGDYKLVRNYDHVNNPETPELELYRLYETVDGVSKRADIEESKNLAESMPEKTQQLAQKLTDILDGMNTTYPYYNPDCSGPLPHQQNVPTVLSLTRSGKTAELTYKENGAKVVRADLIYTTHGGDRDEEWLRTLASVSSQGTVTATLPEGTTHYFINLIDENNFLVSYPKVAGDKPSYAADAMESGAIGTSVQSTETNEPRSAAESEKFSQVDTNADGKISIEEYLAPFYTGFERKDRNSDGVLTPDEHAHASFEGADKDKNGHLTREEYLAIHRRHFANFDKNGDGYITPDERVSAKRR